MIPQNPQECNGGRSAQARPAHRSRPDPQMGGSEKGRAEIVLRGGGTPTREFLYVEDAAEGIVLAAERYSGDQPVNLGTGQEIAIRDLARVVAAEVGFGGEIVWDTSQPNGQPRRCLDVTRARQLFGFEAAHDLRAGIKKTAAWFDRHDRELREVVYA